jgi:hypothetical protein
MSPEIERKRPSKGWRIHERNRKAEERRNKPLGQEERIVRFAIPSWEKMEGIIELRMHNNPELYTLSIKHRGVIREFYDARYAIATKGNWELYEKFFDKYSENERLMKALEPHFTLTRDSINPPHPKR